MLSSFTALVAAAAVFQPAVTARHLTPAGQPRFEAGMLSTPLTGDVPQAVETWALGRREALGLPATSTLRFSHAFSTRWGASAHLRQYVGPVEVYGGRLVVTLDDHRRVVQLSSSVVSHAAAVDAATVDEAQALRLAGAAVPFPALRSDGLPYGGAARFFFDVGDALHLGYLVHVASIDPTKNWYVAIDAITGARLFVQNRVHRGVLDANVYPVSPGGLDAGVGVTPVLKTELRHLDGGSMVAGSCDAFLVDGGWETTANTNAELCGHQLTQFNCCPTEGCQADAGTKRLVGRTRFGQGMFNVDVAFDIGVCDRLRRASPLTNDGGSYEYSPADPPANRTTVVPNDPANSDTFAEVHAFYHVNRVYDWVRGLSASAQSTFAGQRTVRSFAMRDERRTPARKPAVWTNVMFPNFSELQTNIMNFPACLLSPPCSTRSNTLSRVDNAAFFPRENFAQLPLPGFDTGVDTLLIFQGNEADAAYDATVVHHEFGHGVVYATADLTFDAVAIDSRSANNESGALHEAFADYIAAAFNNEPVVGPYFGPRASGGANVPGVRQDDYLRSLTNSLTCPGVLWGEVHQDSQHVSAALWAGRQAFLGTDLGATYDQAFYAMLVSIAPNANFEVVAAAMTSRVAQAFPSVSLAAAQMMGFFQGRGVTPCLKQLDVTNATSPRPYFGIPSSMALGNSLMPGPFQFRIAAPNGARRVLVQAQVGGGSPLGGSAVAITALVKTEAITFTRTGNTLSNDRTVAQELAGQGTASATIDVAVPCGASSEVYVALAAPATSGATAQNVSVSIEPLVNCLLPVVDAGVPDAGSSTPDGGAADAGPAIGTKVIQSVSPTNTATNLRAVTGCGCTSVEVMPLLGAALLFLRRRSVSRTS